MKKLAAIILAILMLCSVYGAMASEPSFYHTIKEALETQKELRKEVFYQIVEE